MIVLPELGGHGEWNGQKRPLADVTTRLPFRGRPSSFIMLLLSCAVVVFCLPRCIHFTRLLWHFLQRLSVREIILVHEFNDAKLLLLFCLSFVYHRGKINVFTHFCQICMSVFFFVFFFSLSWPQGAHLGNLLLLAPGSALICQDWGGQDMGEDIPCPQTVSAHMFCPNTVASLMQYFYVLSNKSRSEAGSTVSSF